MSNFRPNWKSYQTTGNPADIVLSPEVASAFGNKVDAVGGEMDETCIIYAPTTVPVAAQRPAAQKLFEIFSALDAGAVADGKTDCAALLSSTTSLSLHLPPGYFYIGTSITISAKLTLANGAFFLIAPGVTLTLTADIACSDEQAIFVLGNVATSRVILPNNRVSIGWYSIATDGSQDASVTLNSLIANSPAAGRTIYLPAGRYLLVNPVLVGGQNYLTICGDDRGVRSNVDYTTPSAWVGGGTELVLGASNTIGISDPRPSGTFARTSGLVLKDFMISGYSGASVAQTGISVQRDGDGLLIEGVGAINFNGGTGSCCINLFAQDTASLRECWLVESTNALAIGTGKEISISGCAMGAQPGGLTINCSNSVRVNIEGNNIFPDGQSSIVFNNVRWSRIANNVISQRFVGAIVLLSSSYNEIGSNIIRTPNDEVTTWTAGKSQWSSTNYDPINRDELYGIVYVDGSSNYNTVSGGVLGVWTDATNACGIRVKSGAIGNRIQGVSVTGSSSFLSSAYIAVIESAGSGAVTYILDTVLSSQASIAGNAVARYLPTS